MKGQMALVEEFHRKFRVLISKNPSLIPEDRSSNGFHLMKKEVEEYLAGVQNGDIEKVFTLCQKIINMEKRANCFDFYYYERSQKEANLELCKQILNEQFKDNCFFRVIVDSRKEEALCNNIRDENKRESCFATLKVGN